MWIWIAVAAAWDVTEVAVHEDGTYYRAGALYPFADGTLAALATNDAVLVVDPTDNTEIARWDTGGTALEWMPDGSGVVVCAFGGTYGLPWTGTAFGEPLEVDTASCNDVRRAATGVLTLSTPTLALVTLESTTSVGSGDAATVDGDHLYVASGNTILGLDSEFDFAFVPDRLVYGAGQVWATDGNDNVSTGGTSVQGWSFQGDVDGDGELDALFSDDGGVSVVDSASGAVRWMPQVAEGQIAIGGEDCGQWLVITESGYRLYDPVACYGDADGDGATSEEGDCDDSDPARFPGQVEACDHVDDDCDGQVADVELPTFEDTTASEGAEVVFDTPLCDELDGSVAVDSDHCFPTGSSVNCQFPDDGSYDVTIGMLDAPDTEVTVRVEVTNAPPAIVESVVGWPPKQSGTWALTVDDPGLSDTHTFELVDGPSWLELDADGTLRFETPRREDMHLFTVRVTDDDGASTESELTFNVNTVTAPSSSCDAECSVSGLAPVGIATWLAIFGLRRRRR